MMSALIQDAHPLAVTLKQSLVIRVLRPLSPDALNFQDQVELFRHPRSPQVWPHIQQERHHGFTFCGPGPRLALFWRPGMPVIHPAWPHVLKGFQYGRVGTGDHHNRSHMPPAPAVYQGGSTFAFKEPGHPGEVGGRPVRAAGQPSRLLLLTLLPAPLESRNRATTSAGPAMPLAGLVDPGVGLIERMPFAARGRDLTHGSSISWSPFLAQILLPDGETVIEATRDGIAEAYRTGATPQLLAGLRPRELPRAGQAAIEAGGSGA